MISIVQRLNYKIKSQLLDPFLYQVFFLNRVWWSAFIEFVFNTRKPIFLFKFEFIIGPSLENLITFLRYIVKESPELFK